MKTINIFLAGRKELTTERDAIKAMAHDFNKKLVNKIAGKKLVVKSYDDEEFKNRQKQYDDYIRNQAHIAIFLFEEEIGEITSEEFEKATTAYKEKDLPEIIIFFKDKKIDTNGNIVPADDKALRALISEHLDDKTYYVGFSDTAKLKQEANKHVLGFLWPVVAKNMNTLLLTIGTLLLALLGIIGYYLWQQHKNAEPMLLFAGGGSVTNYLKMKGVDVKTYPHSIYEQMPSSHAWILLSEEGNKSLKESASTKFIPVCLSASQATEQDFVFPCSKEDFMRSMVICQYYLAEDTPTVYLSDGIRDELLNRKQRTGSDTVLSAKDINWLVETAAKGNKCVIYTTNPGSGTLKSFQKMMNEQNLDSILQWIDKKRTDKVIVFNEASSQIIDENRMFAFFGSTYYFLNELIFQQKKEKEIGETPKHNYTPIHVVNDKDSIITKPLYLYFIGKIEDKKIVIDKRIISLLKKYNPAFSYTPQSPIGNTSTSSVFFTIPKNGYK